MTTEVHPIVKGVINITRRVLSHVKTIGPDELNNPGPLATILVEMRQAVTTNPDVTYADLQDWRQKLEDALTTLGDAPESRSRYQAEMLHAVLAPEWVFSKFILDELAVKPIPAWLQLSQPLGTYLQQLRAGLMAGKVLTAPTYLTYSKSGDFIQPNQVLVFDPETGEVAIQAA